MVQGILFDLDGTLFDRDSAVDELLRDQHQRYCADLRCISREAYVTRILELDAHGYGDKTEAYQRAAREFGLATHLAEALTADFWSTYHSHGRCFPEVFSVVAQLRDQRLKLGIITNGAVLTQEHKIQSLGLSPLMDTIHISEREGLRKPDSEIFTTGPVQACPTVR